MGIGYVLDSAFTVDLSLSCSSDQGGYPSPSTAAPYAEQLQAHGYPYQDSRQYSQQSQGEAGSQYPDGMWILGWKIVLILTFESDGTPFFYMPSVSLNLSMIHVAWWFNFFIGRWRENTKKSRVVPSFCTVYSAHACSFM